MKLLDNQQTAFCVIVDAAVGPEETRQTQSAARLNEGPMGTVAILPSGSHDESCGCGIKTCGAALKIRVRTKWPVLQTGHRLSLTLTSRSSVTATAVCGHRRAEQCSADRQFLAPRPVRQKAKLSDAHETRR